MSFSDANLWTHMDKPVNELSSSEPQPQTHNFFDLDDEFERDFGSQSLSVDSFRPKHKPVPSRFNVGGEKVASLDGGDLVSEIDCKIKEHVDNVLYAMEGLSARVTQLETRTSKLENTVDDLKESIEYNHGRTDGKLRELENILREVVGGIKDLRDKQEIVEAQLQFEKLQLSKGNPQLGKQNSAAEADLTRQDQSFVPHHPYQFPPDPVSCPQQTAAPSHQNYHMTSTQQSPPMPYLPQQPAPPEITNQQYHVTSTQQSQPPPPALHSCQLTSLETTNQQYHMTPTQQSQPPPPAQYQPYQPTPQPPSLQLSQPPQLHPPSSTVYAQTPSPLSHQHEEVPYLPSQSIQKSSQPPGGVFPPGRFYDGSMQQTNEQPPSRLYSEFLSGYLQSPEDSYSNNLYRYGASPFSSSTSNMKPLRPSPSPSTPHSGISTSQLPTAKILPHALPTASIVESGSPSGESSNRVPVDDVVDQVVAMGFRRDTVKATVRKLTDNGESVDLNVVLDKLMNNG